MTLLSEAIELESEERERAAANKYFLSGVTSVVDSGFSVSPSYRDGVAYCIRSVGMYSRLNERESVVTLSGMIEPLLYKLISDSDSEIEKGLGWEWLGDLYVIFERGDSRYYGNAIEYFEESSLEERLHWGARPEHETMYVNVQRYVDEDIPPDVDYTLNFVERCQWKAGVVG